MKKSAINKLRKHIEQETSVSDQDGSEGDDFENIYKGEVSKSGTPILPSKRARKIPEKISIFKDEKDKVQKEIREDESLTKDNEISLEELKDQEKKEEGSDKLDNSESSDKD